MWRTLFAIDEIEKSRGLQVLFWALLIGFFLSFGAWTEHDVISRHAVETSAHSCPPYFQNCHKLYFFKGGPDSYDEDIFYAVLSLILLGGALAALKQNWALAHASLLLPFAWKVFYITALVFSVGVEFEYFHLPVVFMFLFARKKDYFIRRAFVLTYLLSALAKFHETWIVGTYFTSLSAGMPLVPDFLVPIVTNGLALFETVTPWFLLSTNRRVRFTALGAWLAFHLYSVILVHFHYPLYCVPLMLAIFLHDENPVDRRAVFSRREAVAWGLVVALFAGVYIQNLNLKDWLYTLSNHRFSLAMFIANYQCVSNEVVHYKNGRQAETKKTSFASMNRCGPYPFWYRLSQLCRKDDVAKIEWSFNSSVNGGPFYEIVRAVDACGLRYGGLGTADWITGPSDGAPVVGYPAKNILSRPADFNSQIIHADQKIALSPLQQFLQTHVGKIRALYWVLWLFTFGFFARREFVSSKFREAHHHT